MEGSICPKNYFLKHIAVCYNRKVNIINMQQPKSTIRDYVYSSETKARDQFTLKNIVGGFDGTQPSRNLQSQHSERLYRSNSRPNTMYGQRVRLFLQDENKKTKMQTQIKIKRQQSSYQIKRGGSGVQVKQVSQDEKIKMKKALGKVNLIAEGVDLGLNEEQQLDAIFYFLECLAETSNHYQNAFQYISNRLKGLVFGEKMSQFGSRIKQYLDKNKGSQLLYQVNFLYRSMGKISYQSLADELSKEIQKTVEVLDSFKQKQEQGEHHYEIIIKEKQDLIRKLKKQLKYYQEHPSQDLYPYIKTLEQQNGQMEEEIQELVRIKDDNQYRVQIQENTNMLLSEQIETLKQKIYEFELEELSGMKEVQKNSQLKQFEDNLSNLRAMLDKSKLKMEGMKEQFHKVKAYNEKLINERSKIAKRAAVGFGELTPRPNIKNIFDENNLVYEKYIQTTNKEQSTQQLVKKIVSKLKKQPRQSPELKPPREEKKDAVGEMEGQIGDEAIIEDALNYIDETKQQVNATVIAAEEVKKAFNKQEKDRQSLNKAYGKI